MKSQSIEQGSTASAPVHAGVEQVAGAFETSPETPLEIPTQPSPLPRSSMPWTSFDEAHADASATGQATGNRAGFIVDHSPIPDWCNVGITLRIILGINLLFIGFLLLDVRSGTTLLNNIVTLATTVEPVLLASLLLGCVLRRLTAKQPNAVQIALALLLPAALTFAAQTLLRDVLELGADQILRHALVASVLCAAVLYWAHLRKLAHSPALAEARLQALQSRIRPHFLFNSLNAVLGLIRSDPRRAETALEDLADLFRVLMRDSRERVPLREEVALCKQYLAIEALRLGQRLKVEWHVDDSATHALVPALLLQPLIENAVHHGIEPMPEGGLIGIEIRRAGAYVNIVITNPCRRKEVRSHQYGTLQIGNQIGLDNVRQRLALVHDLEARLETSLHDGRFELKMQLPIHTGA